MTIFEKSILTALERTGFPLEHQVTEAFRKQKWSTLSGRYYIDDTDGQARELDLVAYRTIKIGDIDLVSSVLVSCKKEGENTWAFLSRPAPVNDTNHDWCPIHLWSDEEPLATYLQTGLWKSAYENKARKEQPTFYVATRDVFAYQVVSPPGPQQQAKKAEAKPPPGKAAKSQNDSAIFGSVTGLLKALHYELSVLPERMKGRKRVYVFHLLAVLDGPMVDVRYEGVVPEVQAIDSILHLARYIVAGKRTAALVHFARAAKLPALVKMIDQLAEFDAQRVKELIPQSYAAISETREVQKYFAERLQWSVLYAANKDLQGARSSEKATEFDIVTADGGGLSLEVDVMPDGIAILNRKGSQALAEAARLLSKLAKYTGRIEFAFNIPF